MILCNYKDLSSKKIFSEEHCSIIKNFIEKNILNFQEGRFDLVDGIYANVCQYETSNWKNLFEGHKKYIDIQCVIEGKEFIEVAKESNAIVDKKYDIEKDIIFYQSKILPNNIELSCKNLVVLFPDDLHNTGIILENKCNVKKIIFKIIIYKNRY